MLYKHVFKKILIIIKILVVPPFFKGDAKNSRGCWNSQGECCSVPRGVCSPTTHTPSKSATDDHFVEVLL